MSRRRREDERLEEIVTELNKPDDEDDGGASVREPRRPIPTTGSGAAERTMEDD